MFHALRARMGALLEQAVIAYWRRRSPVTPPGRQWSMALGDNVQGTMNLIMPLRSTRASDKARLAQAMAAASDELRTGLDNIGTVHVARFDIIGDHLCMISVYDGDFATYIRDFIVTIGSVFDAILPFIADPLPPLPTETHIDEFIDWVDEHDLLQIGDLMHLSPHLADVPRALVLLFAEQPHVQLAVYHAYPGVSAAQVRDRLGVGW